MSHPILLAAATLQTTQFRAAERIAMMPAANEPDVKPNYSFPYADTVTRVLGWFLAGIVIFCIAMFFVSAAGIVQAIRGKKEGGVGKNVAGIVAALIVGLLAVAGSNKFFEIAATLD